MNADPLARILSAHQGIADAEARVKQLVADRARFIQEAMADGVSAKDIADALNVDRSRVYRMAKNNYADKRRKVT